MKKCLKSLSASISECQSRRDELLDKRHEGTCAWFFADTQYKEWVESSKQLLWVSGRPGSGKSVLSAIITEEMASYSKRFSVAYFFCKGTDQRLRTDSAILRHLLAQVLDQNPWLFDHFNAEPDYKNDQDKTHWTSGMLWRSFKRLWNDERVENLCLIIDAIGITQLQANKYYMLITSRRMRREVEK